MRAEIRRYRDSDSGVDGTPSQTLFARSGGGYGVTLCTFGVVHFPVSWSLGRYGDFEVDMDMAGLHLEPLQAPQPKQISMVALLRGLAKTCALHFGISMHAIAKDEIRPSGEPEKMLCSTQARARKNWSARSTLRISPNCASPGRSWWRCCGTIVFLGVGPR